MSDFNINRTELQSSQTRWVRAPLGEGWKGALVGGALGSVAGPLGTAAGAAIGHGVGDAISNTSKKASAWNSKQGFWHRVSKARKDQTVGDRAGELVRKWWDGGKKSGNDYLKNRTPLSIKAKGSNAGQTTSQPTPAPAKSAAPAKAETPSNKATLQGFKRSAGKLRSLAGRETDSEKRAGLLQGYHDARDSYAQASGGKKLKDKSADVPDMTKQGKTSALTSAGNKAASEVAKTATLSHGYGKQTSPTAQKRNQGGEHPLVAAAKKDTLPKLPAAAQKPAAAPTKPVVAKPQMPAQKKVSFPARKPSMTKQPVQNPTVKSPLHKVREAGAKELLPALGTKNKATKAF